MGKVAVVFWSGTGNTEAMANAVAQGVAKAGGEAVLLQPSEFGPGDVAAYDAIAFGCPAMGDEILEEFEFQPMWDSVESSLAGKNVVLFGSYDWGTGEWMETWKQQAEAVGAQVLDAIIVNLEPDADALGECERIGALAAA